MKGNRILKKRYIIGTKEVVKHLIAENLKMVIMAVNLERIEEDKGLDDLVEHMILKCRELNVPIVFAFTRYKLGLLTKFKG